MENNNNNQTSSNAVLSTDIHTNLEIVWKLMGEKGLTLGDRIQIRNAISDWARLSNPTIEYDHKFGVYKNTQVKGYHFNREEDAEFIGALVKFIPNADTEKLLQVMSMMLKLFDVNSVLAWKGTR